MKFSTIRNALIKQTIVVIIVLGAVIAPVIYANSLNEEYDQKIISLKSEADTIAKNVSDLFREYNDATNMMMTYSDIQQKRENKMLTVNKLALRDVIVGTRSKYAFANLDVNMGEVKPREGGQSKLTTVMIEESPITINFNAMSDVDIFGLVEALQTAFVGFNFTHMKLTLLKEVDNTVLLSIQQSGFEPLVNAKIDLVWAGLQAVKAVSDPNKILEEDGPTQPGANKSPTAGRTP